MQSQFRGVNPFFVDCAKKIHQTVRMTKSTPTAFTISIREACARHGISLREFMRRLGMANSAITRWETGHIPSDVAVDDVQKLLKEMEAQ